MDIDDGPLWLECSSTTPFPNSALAWKSKERSSANSPQWQSLSSAFTVDNIGNQVFLEDAPFELDESYSSAPTHTDLESSTDSKSTQQTQTQTQTQREDRKHRPYRGYSSLTMSEERELRD